MLKAEGSFRRRVLSAVRRIPIGRVATYGDIARLAGKPRAARAVGNIMRDCRARDVPCHRVIAAGGSIGGYSDLPVKRALLRAEGLIVTSTRVKDFARKRWPTDATVGKRRDRRPIRSFCIFPRLTRSG